MGHLINPIGQRVGFFQFWDINGPLFFNKSISLLLNSLYFYFGIIVRVAFLYLQKKEVGCHFYGQMQQITLNMLNFNYDFCSLSISFFDFMFLVLYYEKSFFDFFNFFLKKLKKLVFYFFFLKLKKRVKIHFNGFVKHFFDKRRYFYISFVRFRTKLLNLCVYQRRLFYSVRTFRFLYFFKLLTFRSFVKICRFNKISTLLVSLRYLYTSNYLTAKMVARYAAIKLSQGFRINTVLRSVIRGVRGLSIFDGYKICLSGRFTRKQIATYRWLRKGRLSLNTMSRQVDFGFCEWVGWYGMCGIKVWLQRSKLRSTSYKKLSFFKTLKIKGFKFFAKLKQKGFFFTPNKKRGIKKEI